MTSKASYFEAWISISGCSCARAMNCFCFLCFLGQESHSNYCQLRDLYAWPWNWRSRHGLRDFCYLCLYLSYRIEFFLFRKVFRSRNSFQLLPFGLPSLVTLKLKVMSWSTWLLLSLILFVLPRWMFYVLLFPKFFRSRKSFHLLSITWPLRVTLKLKVTSWSTWLLLVHDVTFRFKVTR